jgi:hypothetical protein
MYSETFFRQSESTYSVTLLREQNKLLRMKFLKSYQYPAVELHKCQHVHAMSSKIQKSAGSPLEIHDPAV